jgi:hypothetical protein
MSGNNEDDEFNRIPREINLNYIIFQDEDEKSVYVKFEGFETIDQLDEFEQYIESYIPLIFAEETKAH